MHKTFSWIYLFYLLLIPSIAVFGVPSWIFLSFPGVFFIGGLFVFAVYAASVVELTHKPNTTVKAMSYLLSVLFVPTLLLITRGGSWITFFSYSYVVECIGLLLSILLLSLCLSPLMILLKKHAPSLFAQVEIPRPFNTPSPLLSLFFLGILFFAVLPYYPLLSTFTYTDWISYGVGIVIALARSFWSLLFTPRTGDDPMLIVLTIFIFIGAFFLRALTL